MERQPHSVALLPPCCRTCGRFELEVVSRRSPFSSNCEEDFASPEVSEMSKPIPWCSPIAGRNALHRLLVMIVQPTYCMAEILNLICSGNAESNPNPSASRTWGYQIDLSLGKVLDPTNPQEELAHRHFEPYIQDQARRFGL